MTEQKNLTQNGMTIPYSLNFLFIVINMFLCLYLTKYYFDFHYPVSLVDSSSICDLSSFWSCDAATSSPFSNIAGVPVAFFGLLLSVFLLSSCIFPSEAMEKTGNFLAKLNFLGSLIFMSYSIFALKSLCPLCTTYFAFSTLIAFLYWKYSYRSIVPDVKILAATAAIVLVGSIFIYQYNDNKKTKQTIVNQQIIEQYFTLPNLGEPKTISPFRLLVSTENFMDAPIRISVFSDFQCPFCKVLAEQMKKIEKYFEGKMNVNYYFYPLDSACNSKVTRQIHPLACPAAYVAACDQKTFKTVHDAIFENQEKLSMTLLEQIQTENNLSGCMENEAVKNSVKAMIAQGEFFNLRSTPTLIINGVKIEGSLKNDQFIALFNEILKRTNK
ncbi:MAG: thioredoxin domain-containing protein [Bacteriovoracaceae bacterium]|nr:thioredoxin domain-containing protein [Bacteriovoracaceae bacterium]